MKKREAGYRRAYVAATAAVLLVVAASGLGVPFLWQAAIGVAGVIAAAVVGKGSREEAEPARDAPTEALPDKSPSPAISDLDRENMLRMEADLSAAHEIQMLLVPRTFPPLRGCPPFDLYAVLEPAKEIGGDFYDYWMLGRENLALVVADVSGKGIPSALYMAMVRTYLRAFSRHIHDPAELLTRLNREVARHNPSNMFVTVFCSVINLETGKTDFANAGHNRPLRRKPNQTAEWFPDPDNPPVGFIPDLTFTKQETTLEPGEMLLLYTDGVTEAMNKNDEMIGESRVLEIFDTATEIADSCRAVAMNMQSTLSEFATGRDPYDDITIMTYRHPDGDDWDLDTVCSEGEADFGDSVLSSLGSLGDVAVSLTDYSAVNKKFFSLTDLK